MSPVWGWSAGKDLVITRGQMTLTLTSKPCTDEAILSQLEAAGVRQYMGSILLGGRVDGPDDHTTLCYFVVEEDHNQIFVIDATGGMGFIKLDPSKKS